MTVVSVVLAGIVPYLFAGIALAAWWRSKHTVTPRTSRFYDFFLPFGAVGVAIGWPVAFAIVYPLIWLVRLAIRLGHYRRPPRLTRSESIAQLEAEVLDHKETV